jgi:hypothetical protein
MAQEVAEEAMEIVIEAVRGERSSVINESVDLIYDLVVLSGEIGINTSDLWAEMDLRQALLGMAEKLPKEGGISAKSPVGDECRDAVKWGKICFQSGYSLAHRKGTCGPG